MAEVVITEFMDEAAVGELARARHVVYEPSLANQPDRLRSELADARALIVRNKTMVTDGLLDSAPDLVLVARLGVGLDNIDLDACRQRGIEVVPATGANAPAVAEYVIAASLLLLRGSFGLTARVASGEWPRSSGVGREAMGRTLGLVGYGAIAREVATRARGLGMTIAGYDPYLPEDDVAWEGTQRLGLEELLGVSDVLSVHVPLTESTRDLIDRSSIASMKSGAVLINTSRGGVVDERALVEALHSGQLGGAALDVFSNEPLDGRSGEMFRDVPDLILTPHTAGITIESEHRTGRMMVEAVDRALGGGS